MSKKYSIYWYQEDPQLKRAHLCNCRDRDIQRQGDGTISLGTIIAGAVGYVVAESNVVGFSGQVVVFTPSHKCKWEGMELPCMCHPVVNKAKPRDFNYVVADFSDSQAQSRAKQVGLPLIQSSDGRVLANLEIAVFQAQGPNKYRRAKLI